MQSLEYQAYLLAQLLSQHLELGKVNKVKMKLRGLSTTSDETSQVLTVSTNAEDYFNQGLEQLRQGNFETAIESFTQALRLNPNFAAAYVARADIYLQQGKEQNAVRDYSRATTILSKLSFDDIVKAQGYPNRGVSNQ